MQSIGERLEQTRKKLGLSIEEVASATKIRSDYIVSLEKSNGDDISLPEIYVRGFIKNYAKFIKMDPSRLLADFDASRRTHTQNPFNKTSKEIMGRLDITPMAANEPSQTPQPKAPTKPTPPPSAESIFKAAPTPPETITTQTASTSPIEPAKPIAKKPAGPVMKDLTRNPTPPAPINEKPAISFDELRQNFVEGLKGLPKWTLPTLISLISLVILTSIVVVSCTGYEEPTDTDIAQSAIITPLKLYASGNVTVIVRDATTNETLYSGVLKTGEQKTIPSSGDVQIRYSDGDVLEVEKGEKRYKLGGTGPGKRIIR